MTKTDKEWEALDREIDRCDAIGQQHDFVTRWSMGLDSGVDFDAPHPFEGVTTMTHVHHWGECGAIETPIDGPTWLDLWRTADRLVQETLDFHHHFIEAFVVKDGKLELHCGS